MVVAKEDEMKIQQLRNKLRLTQKEFAKAINVSIQSVSAWETGKKSPSYRSIKVIEQKFEVKLDY